MSPKVDSLAARMKELGIEQVPIERIPVHLVANERDQFPSYRLFEELLDSWAENGIPEDIAPRIYINKFSDEDEKAYRKYLKKSPKTRDDESLLAMFNNALRDKVRSNPKLKGKVYVQRDGDSISIMSLKHSRMARAFKGEERK